MIKKGGLKKFRTTSYSHF